MSGYSAFVKKEFMENTRNFRLAILLTLFLVFGLLSPLIARFSQELITALSPQMQITFHPPTALDSWEQFYKNVSGIGFSALIILFGSCLSNEYAKGTLVLMLTKGLSRPAVIVSKFSAAAAIMTLCFWGSFGVTYGYTAYLLPGAALPHTLFAAFALWIMGMLYLSILLLGCVLFKQTFTSILFTGGVVALLSLLGMAEPIARFSPMILTTKNLDLLAGRALPSDCFIPMIIAVLLAMGCLFAAVVRFSKKQI